VISREGIGDAGDDAFDRLKSGTVGADFLAGELVLVEFAVVVGVDLGAGEAANQRMIRAA
jgi:hypothetical protein